MPSRNWPTRRCPRSSPSGAQPVLKADEAGLLPCRVHAFFRGLPGLWACLDPDCTVDRAGIPKGPIGAMYGQPQNTCDCGARVFELFTCRQCGTAYARAYTDDVENPVVPLAGAGPCVQCGIWTGHRVAAD